MKKREIKKIEIDEIYSMLRGSKNLKSIRFRARGDSMQPFIKPGDIVTIESVAPGCFRVGDVVVFHNGNVSVVHRLLFQYSRGGFTWLMTKGDAMPSPDEPVPSNRVLGRVVAIERNGRKYLLDQPMMRTASVLLALASPFSGYYFGPAVRVRNLIRSLRKK